MGRASLDCTVPACTGRHSTHKQSKCPVQYGCVGFFASTSCLSKNDCHCTSKNTHTHRHQHPMASNGRRTGSNRVYSLGEARPVLESGAWVAPGAVVVGNVLMREEVISLPLYIPFPRRRCLVHRAEHRQYCTLYCTYQMLRTAPRDNAAGYRLGR